MGNRLTSIIPAQILPIETYFSDLPDIQFESSLGSTRFLKVAKCSSAEGLLVVKVFVIHDPSLHLAEHKKKLDDVSHNLSNAVNCLQYHHSLLTEKAAFMIRQYVKSSLYDRMSTRPFLTDLEKKWLTFQLLCALNQCHQRGIVHGDIKLENIMVTSWMWLFLTDFASYKPVALPWDNPADFLYFFDTSRRRSCYIAPERVPKPVKVKVSSKDDPKVMEEILVEVEKPSSLNPVMDIFSAGCALMELFSDGLAPFQLSDTFNFQSNAYYPDKVIAKIECEEVKTFLKDMIQLDPTERKTAEEYLERERGRLFPECFYSFLWPFFKQFVVMPVILPDDKIKCIKKSLSDILIALGCDEVQADVGDLNDNSLISDKNRIMLPESVEYHLQKHNKLPQKCDSMVLIVSLITSSIRSLNFSSSKLDALELLTTITPYVADDVILDRILPYVLQLLEDPEQRVRVKAIFTLTFCLSVVSAVPRSDVNIFPEYIWLYLNDLTQDNAQVVRKAFAENIATLADTAVRFLDYCQLNHYISFCNYEKELVNLHKNFQEKVAALFSDSSNAVKRTLVEKSTMKLCIFFGRQKIHDVILSHMITFLNDKQDFQLRMTFFRSIVGIASFIGMNCSDILIPLLVQGLNDAEEAVMIAALDAMTALLKCHLLPYTHQCKILAEAAPFLIHPNFWIRQEAINFVTSVANIIPLPDVLTTFSRAVSPYLTRPVVQMQKEVILLSALQPCIRRDIYDILIQSPDVFQLLQTLNYANQKKISLNSILGDDQNFNYQFPSAMKELSDDNSTCCILRRLYAAGLTDDILGQLNLLSDHIAKRQKYKRALDAILKDASDKLEPGFVNLDAEKVESLANKYDLILKDVLGNFPWFPVCASQLCVEMGPVPSGNAAKILCTTDALKAFTTCKSESQKEFERLLYSEKMQQQMYLTAKRAQGRTPFSAPILPADWRPKGHLVAHLHEHKGTISRLVSLKGDSRFASCSSDGTVKLWDCSKTERDCRIIKSKATYNRQRGQIIALASCYTMHAIAAASDDGSIHVIRDDKMSLSNSRVLNREEDGHAVDMNFYETGSRSVLTYATLFGSLVGWDLRAPGEAWKIENGVNKGVIMSYVIEPSQSWLLLGTSSGYLTCWDLRFMLPISTILHPRGAGVRRVCLHPTMKSWVVSAMTGNNEVSMWDVETQSRHKVLWASNCMPLNPPESSNNSVFALHLGETESGPFALTGGSDARIRYWDLVKPEDSYLMSCAALDSFHKYSVMYSSRLVDEAEVIVESTGRQHSPPSFEEHQRHYPEQSPLGHKDIISDMLVVHDPQRFIVTSGTDGTIKLWK